MRQKGIYSILIIGTLLTSGCRNTGREEPFRLHGEAQGTYYSIIYYDTLQRDMRHDIDSLLDAFDMTASLWNEESLLRQVNDNHDSIVNQDFANLVEISRTMYDHSGGTFDCTVGKLVNAWGFGFAKREEMTDQKIDSLLQYVGQQPTIINDDNGRLIVRKATPESSIDFNAVAQGYSTDMVCKYFDSQGISDYLVDIGGEVYAKGNKADGTAWSVGIERPAENMYSSPEVETTIELRDMAVVTSGNYRKYYEKDGIRYSHTIDPHTGRPVEHTLLSVTVVDRKTWRADAMATAFMVMGLERAKQFIADHADDPGTQAVFFIYGDKEGYKTYATEGFKELVKKTKSRKSRESRPSRESGSSR